MNKLGVVLGIAAVAVVAGCKDPDYVNPKVGKVQNQPVDISVQEEPEVAQPEVVEARPKEEIKIVETKAEQAPKPVEEKSVAVKPVEPEYTVYIVQRGDYLSKISKKYNIKVAAIKELNGLKGDMIKIGQKLKLPGKVDVGEQKAPAKAAAKPAKSGKAFTAYTGATKEYVVKSGDTLGAIAYGNGINIRQLKQMNNLKSDMLKVGQKLKIPAEKAVKAAPAAAKVASPVVEKPVVAPVVETPVAPAADDGALEQPVAAPAAAPEATATAPEAAAAPAATGKTHTVKEGEDLTGISITWGVSPAAICELNNINDTDPLVPGTVLKLPADAQQ